MNCWKILLENQSVAPRATLLVPRPPCGEPESSGSRKFSAVCNRQSCVTGTRHASLRTINDRGTEGGKRVRRAGPKGESEFTGRRDEKTSEGGGWNGHVSTTVHEIAGSRAERHKSERKRRGESSQDVEDLSREPRIAFQGLVATRIRYALNSPREFTTRTHNTDSRYEPAIQTSDTRIRKQIF